ncbi:hypothetical protein EXIGLDRAFT_780714, partial [Exidia glandulosa HHB12029]
MADSSSSSPSSATFVASEWIGCGRRFPSPAPYHLLVALRAVLKIPLIPSFDIPHSRVSVPALIDLALPSLDSTKNGYPVFLADNPEVDELSYEGLKVPALSVITELSRGVKQAWLDGKRSFILRHISTKRLPFWLVNFWFHIHPAVHTASVWRAALNWCNSLDHIVQLSVENALISLGWKQSVRWAIGSGGTEMQNLACLLRADWINDSVVGSMLCVLQKQLERDSPTSRSRVLGIDFARPLSATNAAFFNTYCKKRAPKQYEAGELLASGACDSVFY